MVHNHAHCLILKALYARPGLGKVLQLYSVSVPSLVETCNCKTVPVAAQSALCASQVSSGHRLACSMHAVQSWICICDMSVTVIMFLARLILSQLRLEMPHSDMQTTQRHYKTSNSTGHLQKKQYYVHITICIASAASFFSPLFSPLLSTCSNNTDVHGLCAQVHLVYECTSMQKGSTINFAGLVSGIWILESGF